MSPAAQLSAGGQIAEMDAFNPAADSVAVTVAAFAWLYRRRFDTITP